MNFFCKVKKGNCERGGEKEKQEGHFQVDHLRRTYNFFQEVVECLCPHIPGMSPRIHLTQVKILSLVQTRFHVRQIKLEFCSQGQSYNVCNRYSSEGESEKQ
jgi:hypothetical protein